MNEKKVVFTEAMYDRICAILTSYEEGCEDAPADMYSCLVDIQEMYVEAEE